MIRLIFLRCLLTIVCWLTMVAAWAQANSAVGSPDHTITKRFLSIEEGLASHEVFCGLQDNQGFLWFGTRNGLNRYDGNAMQLYTRQRNGLRDNKVVQLAKDDGHLLFIAYGSMGFQLSTNGKIDVFNTLTQEVRSLTAAFPQLPFKEQDVYWIANDGTDEISLLTAFPFRLWKYSARKGFVLRYQVDAWSRQNGGHTADYRSAGPLCVFAGGKALLKVHNQLPQFLVSSDTVIAFQQPDALRSLPLGYDQQQNLFITYNTARDRDAFAVGWVAPGGVHSFPALAAPASTDSIRGRYWFQVACAADGASSVLYIPTDGLYLWRPDAYLKFIGKQEVKGFENLYLYQVFPDALGHLWLCTSAGVIQVKIERNHFSQYFTSKQQSREPNSQVRGIYADETGLVAANVWQHLFVQRGPSVQWLKDEEIRYALTYHAGSLYCGAYNLWRYDTVKHRLLKEPGSQLSEIWSMYSANDSLLLLGRTNGIWVFNSNTHTYDSLPYVSPAIPAAKFVYRFLPGRGDTIWAVAENGLYCIRKGAARDIHTWSISKCQPPALEQLSLLDAYMDADGICWIATSGEGLFRWDRRSGEIRSFTIASGLPSDVLYRIEPDNFGHLWISSDYGLVCFDRKTFAVKTYTTADGISHNEFNRTSSFRAVNGQLFFGGIDGVNAFDPKDLAATTGSLNVPLRITAFSQFDGASDQLVNKTGELLADPHITLQPGDRFFTLEFRLLDFAPHEVHRYAYRIEGVDKDWNYIQENSIRISGLPYGTHRLLVKAQNREGAWSQQLLSIPVWVIKPFYLRWWFVVLAGVALIGIVYLVIRARTRQLAADKLKLAQLVDERTGQLKHSLEEQAALVAEKDTLLKEIHHRVKNNLQVISGLLELQGKNLTDDAAREALIEGRNRVRSIALIHQNLYQFEDLNSIELKRFVNDLCRQIESVYQRQDVAVSIEVPALLLDIDTAVPLGLILNELLSNSFKYAFNDGKPGRIDLPIHDLAGGRFELRYADTGPGLPEGFDVRKAKTLGMQLIHDLSRQIGGAVHYSFDQGAVFMINFANRELRKNED